MSGEHQIPLFLSRGVTGEPDSASLRDVPEVRGASRETALTVSELNATARELIEGAFQPMWVTGEVANWRKVASGHCYFSLRDEAAQLDCAMFRSDVRRLPTEPEEGMEVCAFGQVSLYEARGRFQLVVREMEAKGAGLWRLAFERLRQKLESEGLLDAARKRPVPPFPSRVGVVTSRTGAALRDVISVIRRRAPWTHILVGHCRVQGEGAVPEICAALRDIGSFPGVDVMILTRGGGSVEDLWGFNHEDLARAVVASPVPVISAVGHEIDVTIVDLVADLRAPTPSSAAELVVPDRSELSRRFRSLAVSLEERLRERTRLGEERRQRVEVNLFRCLRDRLKGWSSRVERYGDRLHTLSPLATLRRGYAVAIGAGGEVLRNVGMFEDGGLFDLRVVDGTVHCRTDGSVPTGELSDGG